MNNHQLILCALGVGLEDAAENHGKEIEIRKPPIFNSDLEPVSSISIICIDGVDYSVTIGKA